MKYIFEVSGKVTGKGRPRVNTSTGIAYTPTKTKDYETLIEQYFLLKYPRFNKIESRVRVEIEACFSVPKTANIKEKEQMLSGNISPTKKPDIDNIAKIVLDALNQIAFKDDNQITQIIVNKKYADSDKLVVLIEEY